jgi:hypothetical protein
LRESVNVELIDKIDCKLLVDATNLLITVGIGEFAEEWICRGLVTFLLEEKELETARDSLTMSLMRSCSGGFNSSSGKFG